MIKYLKITNKGEIDWRLISLLGGTTKRDNDALIGRYGSGLKYTLAYLLRENLDFKIYSGKKLLKIKTESETIRDQIFDIICIDGHRTSITTKMGPDFKAWHCIREILANSIDEGDSKHCITTKCGGVEGETSFYVQVGPQIQEVLDNWDKYFIENRIPLFQDSQCRIYPGSGNLKIYKNGILIQEVEESKSLFHYDYLHASINELREHQGSISYTIYQCLQNADSKVCKYFLENIREEHYEGSSRMDYTWYGTWMGGWKETIGSAKLITKESINNIRAKGIDIDEDDYLVVPPVVYTHLTKEFVGVGALHTVQKGHEFMEHYDPIVENRVKQALTILEHCDYIFHPELVFKFGYFEDKCKQACVNMSEKVVYMSNTLLSTTLFKIVGILMEENEHFITGFQDCSRQFQQHWIDLYVKEMLTKHEVEV